MAEGGGPSRQRPSAPLPLPLPFLALVALLLAGPGDGVRTPAFAQLPPPNTLGRASWDPTARRGGVAPDHCQHTVQVPPGYYRWNASAAEADRTRAVTRPLCVVADLSASPVAYWHGAWSSARYHPRLRHGLPTPAGPDATIPAPLTVETARGLRARPFRECPTPAAAFILHARNAFVGTAGTVFTDTLTYSNGRWYRTLPEAGLRVVVVDRPLLTLAGAYMDLFQHFMFEVLPRISLVLEYLLDPEVVVLHSGGVATSFLTAFGVPVSRQMVAEADVVYASSEVLFPGFALQGMMGLLPRGIVTPAASLLTESVPLADRNLVLYLDREQGEHRCVRKGNEVALLSAIRRALTPPYKLVVFSDVKSNNWQRDKQLFASAHVVLGPHGGAHANAGFCQPKSHVVEFIPQEMVEWPLGGRPTKGPGSVRPCYLGLAHAADLHYWQVEPSHFAFLAPDMQVPVDDVLAILAHIGVATAPASAA